RRSSLIASLSLTKEPALCRFFCLLITALLPDACPLPFSLPRFSSFPTLVIQRLILAKQIVSRY
ncbi:hypothetical protein, partial [Aeromonas hydrophila]|uniref:hypothetical protein n=1 Tax=Aeromonas hydrophila TaxID=644 RepID=UPI0036DE2010